jgi:HTH-type transcriptional regulator/antitoxin HipB
VENLNNFSKQLGDEVKAQRKKAGLSQKQLADFAGVGKTVVYDIEHGKSTIRVETLNKVLAVMNMQLDFKRR